MQNRKKQELQGRKMRMQKRPCTFLYKKGGACHLSWCPWPYHVAVSPTVLQLCPQKNLIFYYEGKVGLQGSRGCGLATDFYAKCSKILLFKKANQFVGDEGRDTGKEGLPSKEGRASLM